MPELAREYRVCWTVVDAGNADSFAHAASSYYLFNLTTTPLPQYFFKRSAHVQFPQGEDLLQVMVDFEALEGLPQCSGAIDGCLIPMQNPPDSGLFREKYSCYKNFPAINRLAVYDAHLIFTYVDAGHAGSVGDAGAFDRSLLKSGLISDKLFPMSQADEFYNSLSEEPVLVHPFLVGDAALPFFLRDERFTW